MTWVDLQMSGHVGFKEWGLVCDALASGRQSVLLRKGGIHEGREGFSFAHESFFLFPTRFHATSDQIREGVAPPLPEWQVGELIQITHHVQVEWAETVTDWEKVASLEACHIYTEQTVRERFDWAGKGMSAGSIHVALVRVKKLGVPWQLPYGTQFGGCRSWVKLPPPPVGWDDNLDAVIADQTFDRLKDSLDLRSH